MRFGAAAGLRALPAWKQAADFLCVQIGFSLDDLLAWRAQLGAAIDVPVYAGVIVVASAGMARTFTIPGVDVPPDLVQRLEKDANAGVDASCDLVVGIRDSGAFDGAHLIPVARYREVAARLERVALIGRRRIPPVADRAAQDGRGPVHGPAPQGSVT